jgi:hypothetical protein
MGSFRRRYPYSGALGARHAEDMMQVYFRTLNTRTNRSCSATGRCDRYARYIGAPAVVDRFGKRMYTV